MYTIQDFLEKLLQHFFGRRAVGARLHRTTRAALAEAAHGARVTEELREGGFGVDHRAAAAGFLIADDRATLLQIADEIAHVSVGRGNFELHNRLEQHNSRDTERGVECQIRRGAEGDIGAAGLMHFTSEQGHFQSHQRKAEQSAALSRVFEFFEHHGEHVGRQTVIESIRHHIATDRGIKRFDANADFGDVLHAVDQPVALARRFSLASHGLAITHAGVMYLHVEIEVAFEPVLNHFEVQFTHAADQGLAGLFVFAGGERGVLLAWIRHSCATFSFLSRVAFSTRLLPLSVPE